MSTGSHDIAEVAWGDVISDDDGVLVVAGDLDGLPVVVKRFATGASAREVATYRLLQGLGVPTLPVLGSGADWLILEELGSAGYRKATADDLADPAIARLVAQWYDSLHAAGDTLAPDAIDFSELDLITEEGLATVATRWPDLTGTISLARGRLPHWRDLMATLPRTLTHNDFWFTNLAVYWDGSSALMYDHNRLFTIEGVVRVWSGAAGRTGVRVEVFR